LIVGFGIDVVRITTGCDFRKEELTYYPPLFNNGHVQFVKAERLDELKWEVEESDDE